MRQDVAFAKAWVSNDYFSPQLCSSDRKFHWLVYACVLEVSIGEAVLGWIYVWGCVCMLMCSLPCLWLGVRKGAYFTQASPAWSCYAFFPWYPRKTEEKSCQCSWKGQSLPPLLFATQVRLQKGQRLPRNFLLGSQCSFVSRWFFRQCLEPWLLVLILCLCSLFTPCSVTAVRAALGEPVPIWRSGVASQPCFSAQLSNSTLFILYFFFAPFLCLLTQEWKPVARAFEELKSLKSCLHLSQRENSVLLGHSS